MFETDMPAKRQFNVFPSPENLVRLAFRITKLLVLTVTLWLGGTYALSYAGVFHLWPWGHSEVAEAATAPVQPHVTNAVDRHDQSVEEYVDDRVFSAKLQLCQSMKMTFDGKTCQKPPPPAAWSGEGITGKPPMRLHEAQEKLADARAAAPHFQDALADAARKFRIRPSTEAPETAEAEPEETERQIRRMVDENERRPPRMADSGPQPGLRLRHQSPRDCREGQYWDPHAWFGMGGCLYDHGER